MADARSLYPLRAKCFRTKSGIAQGSGGRNESRRHGGPRREAYCRKDRKEALGGRAEMRVFQISRILKKSASTTNRGA
jgi:hypothetical protein